MLAILLKVASDEALGDLLPWLGIAAVLYLIIYKLYSWWRNRPKDADSVLISETAEENTTGISSTQSSEQEGLRLAA